MTEKVETNISLEALCLLASFTVRETLHALQAKELITKEDSNAILARAVDGLNMTTIGLTKTDTDNLVNALMGRRFIGPDRNLN